MTEESEVGAGTLFSSGLIAGGSIAGILVAILVGTGYAAPLAAVGNYLPWFHADDVVGKVASSLLFLALAVIVARSAQKKTM